MGLGTNIILMMLSISFFFYLGGYPNNFSVLVCSLGGGSYFGMSCSGVDTLYGVVYALIFLIGAVSAAASVLFPNPYTMFAPWALFLLGFFTFPIGIFNSVGLPGEVVGFITVFYSAAYLFSIIEFVRGIKP